MTSSEHVYTEGSRNLINKPSSAIVLIEVVMHLMHEGSIIQFVVILLCFTNR